MRDGHENKIRTPARWLTCALAAVALVLVSVPRAGADQQAMEPNSVLAADKLQGAQLERPADGRLRGYRFAVTITDAGTADAFERLVSTFRAAEGQRLAVVAFRFDLLTTDSSDHPVHAVVIVDGKRTSLDDRDFVRSGERTYAASVPTDAKDVDLEVSAGGVAQVFSVTQRRRIGDQPAVLYRDLTGPEATNDLNVERTLAAKSPDDGRKGAVSITLRQARLSYFSPDEPITNPPTPDEAYLILNAIGDGVEPSSKSPEWGNYFSDFSPVPASAVKAKLADGATVDAQHTGDGKGLLGGSYFFTVPAATSGATVTVTPGTVDGVEYRSFTGRAARVQIDGTASFEVSFGPGSPAGSVSSTTTTTATSASGPPVTHTGRQQPASHRSNTGSRLAWLAVLVVGALAAVALRGRWRQVARRPALERDHPHPVAPEARSPRELLGLDPAGRLSITGPGAEGVVRALVLDLLSEPETEDAEPFVVVVEGETANLLPVTEGVPGLVVVDDANEAMGELEVLATRRYRLAHEAAGTFGLDDDEEPVWRHDYAPAVLIAPGPLDPRWRAHLDALLAGAAGRYPLTAVTYGPAVADGAIALYVTADGYVGGGGEVVPPRLEVASAAEAATGLSLLVSLPTPVPAAPPASEPASTTDQSSLARAVVSVRLLGPYRIEVGGKEVTTGLRAKARELLAFLVVRRQGATGEVAIEALYPDVDGERAGNRFRTDLANLRTTLREALGLSADVVERVGNRYRLDPSLFDVDVWRFDDALARTRGAGEAEARAAGLEAAEAYGGDFASGEYFAWAEGPRQDLRGEVVKVLTASADARRRAGEVDAAMRLMEEAIRHDPKSEELYRSLMEMQREAGRRDAVAQTYRLLEQRLSELGLKPNDQTRRLLDP